MISFFEARQLIANASKRFARETVSIEEAVGRVVLPPVIADRDYPPFNRSMMDGFAVKFDDVTAGITTFRQVGEVFAGDNFQGDGATGTCVKIMTGAPVPASYDMVVPVEQAEVRFPDVHLTVKDGRRFHFIAKRGEDLREKESIVNIPMRATASVIGLLSTLGHAKVDVAVLPKVAIISTGNEVVPIDQEPSMVQIRNSNTAVLAALLQEWKISAPTILHVKDDRSELESAFREHLKNDLLIVSGGVSAGDADFVPAALNAAGARCIFHKLAIRPGKPLWFGQTAEGCTVFALPGNPLSAQVGYLLFIDYFLRSCFELPPRTTIKLPLARPKTKSHKLDEFFLFKYTGDPSAIEPITRNSSGDIRIGLDSNGIAWHPANIPDLDQDAILDCWTW